MTVAAVCTALNREGVPTKRGGPWRHATVWAMLHRSHFWGKATHGYSRRVELSDDKSLSRKNPDPSELIEIPVPAIVSEELAIRAQEQCRRNLSQAKRNAKADYLLGGGLLRCGQCAAEGYIREDGQEFVMAGKKARSGWRHYRCNQGRHRAYIGDRPSSYHAVNAAHVERAVWDKLRELVSDPERVAAQHAALSGAHEGEVRALDADLARLDEEIAALEAKRAALLDLVGALAKDRLLQKDAEFAAQQSTLALRRADLLRQRAQLAGAVLPIGSVRALCDLVRRRMEGDLSFEERVEIVRLLVDRIVVTKERYRLHCVLPGLDEDEAEGALCAITPIAPRRCRRDRRGGRA
jgi:site-specific DNA recombinase